MVCSRSYIKMYTIVGLCKFFLLSKLYFTSLLYILIKSMKKLNALRMKEIIKLKTLNFTKFRESIFPLTLVRDGVKNERNSQ